MSGRDFTVGLLIEADVIIDLTCEGLMHAKATRRILESGTRIMTISDEIPEILCRLTPKIDMKEKVKKAVAMFKKATNMTIKSEHGTELIVNIKDSPVVGFGVGQPPNFGSLARRTSSVLSTKDWQTVR